MNDKAIEALFSHKKQTVSLTDLEKLFAHEKLDYPTFADRILTLENLNYLTMVKSQGRNHKTPALAFTYKIQKGKIKEIHEKEIHHVQFGLRSPQISLDAYFMLPPNQFKADLPYIFMIDDYITTFGLPFEPVPAPERSVELTGNEKWITDEGGKSILERLKVWELLLIMPVSEPLMFAINPSLVSKDTPHWHLIVENKTTYQGLLHVLPETLFSTLIYGSGKKVISGLEHFEDQFPVITNEHHFFYFGDLDYEGISIWDSLNKRVPIVPAIPFYEQCLAKNPSQGKTNHRKNEAALNNFFTHFDEPFKQTLTKLLEDGFYYPQEVLRSKELQQIWRNGLWNESI
ncbi:Wadjet anti-phage system protein JetD domain-containing protein [Salipaludibacillus sp. HK11]|uniref:Wadjet anti-phage system protein JetD domain-containing protein n=1 Tax=Salipaludibacillus sp. HK11 TaxID=3394320 RepID=UPI0039FCBD19